MSQVLQHRRVLCDEQEENQCRLRYKKISNELCDARKASQQIIQERWDKTQLQQLHLCMDCCCYTTDDALLR